MRASKQVDNYANEKIKSDVPGRSRINKKNGADRLTRKAVYRLGKYFGGYGLWANVSWDSFVAKWQEWSNNGLRLVDMNLHRVGGKNRYSGVWLAGSGGYYLWANVTWENFRAKWQQLAEQGQRLIDYEFVHTGDGPSFDALASSPKLAAPKEDFSTAQAAADGFGGIIGDLGAEVTDASSSNSSDRLVDPVFYG